MSLDYDFNASDLDEFLAEYVDGTMDVVVREAFEEFLNVYPEVAEQVDCLASIRSQLCRLGDKCRCHAPPGFQDRLKEQLLEESTDGVATKAETWLPHLNTVAVAFSLTLLALALSLSGSTSLVTLAESNEIEKQGEKTPLVLDASLFAIPMTSKTRDFAKSIALTRHSYSNVSHTHPGSVEIHVDAAFHRPMLLSVRRDAVAMRPVVDRQEVVYTRP